MVVYDRKMEDYKLRFYIFFELNIFVYITRFNTRELQMLRNNIRLKKQKKKNWIHLNSYGH